MPVLAPAPQRKPNAKWRNLGCVTLVALTLLAGTEVASATRGDTGATWDPVASERLIKLPGTYLKRAIDNDFAGSRLAAEIREVESFINLKTETLTDLQNASEQAEGDLRIELQHQFLFEKREFLELVGRHQDLRRQQMTTKRRLFQRLIKKLEREEGANTPESQALVEKQEAARRRMEASISQVDLKIFDSPMTSQSRYAQEYAKNVVAIERLLQAINAHPMNAGSEIDGRPVTKKQYLRQLMAEAEAELQIIDQEETVLGYMAKLVALDALALNDLLAEPSETENASSEDEPSGLASAVDYFITQ